jgi:hypothetical protein
MSRVIPLFKLSKDQPHMDWCPAALTLLETAPDRIAVLKQYIRRFRPMRWSGSLAATMETRLPLLHAMKTHIDPAVATLATTEEACLKSEIHRVREHETQEDRVSDERFE